MTLALLLACLASAAVRPPDAVGPRPAGAQAGRDDASAKPLAAAGPAASAPAAAVLPQAERDAARREIVTRASAFLSKSEAARELVEAQQLLKADVKLWLPGDVGPAPTQAWGEYVYHQGRPLILFNGQKLGVDPRDAEAGGSALAAIAAHELDHHRSRVLHGDVTSQENEERALERGARVLLEQIVHDPVPLTRLSGELAGVNRALVTAWLAGFDVFRSMALKSYEVLPSILTDDPNFVAEQLRKAMLLERLLGRPRAGDPLRPHIAGPGQLYQNELMPEFERALSFWTDAKRLDEARRRHLSYRADFKKRWTLWRHAHKGARFAPGWWSAAADAANEAR